jgi:hypothetical protein
MLRMRKVLRALLIAVAVLGVVLATLIAFVLYDHESFVKVLIQANEKMNALGAGVTNGKRSGEGIVIAWSHDPAFDALKLKESMTILRSLDKDGRVTAIRIDLRDSGIKDPDLSLLQGLPKLESVDLSRTGVTREGVAALLALYPTIRVNTNDFTGKTYK